MATANNPNYYIVPTAITITPNSYNNDPQYVIIGTAVRAAIMLINEWGVTTHDGKTIEIGYAPSQNYKQWTMSGGQYALQQNCVATSCHVYVRVPKAEGETADFVFSQYELDILGQYKKTEGEGDAAKEVIVKPSTDSYYYVHIATLAYDSTSKTRSVSYLDTGMLRTAKGENQKNTGDLDKMFKIVDNATINVLLPFKSLVINTSLSLAGTLITGIRKLATGIEAWAEDDAHLATCANIAAYIKSKLDALDDKYLRKDQDDATTHTLTIQNGIFVEDVVIGGDLGVDGNTTIGGTAAISGNTTIGGDTTIGGTAAISGNTTIGGTLDVDKDTTIKGKSYLKDDVAIGNPVKAEVSGTTGGATINKEGDIAARSLALSEFLEVPEIRFNRASIVVGTNIQSPCGGIIGEVYPDKDEDGNLLPAGYAVLELGDDDIAGSIVAGDYCWGYFHDVNSKSNNATEDSDDHAGNITYKGFATVYFYIQEVLNANSTRFRYELREGTTIHPYVGMHFGGRGNNTDKSRQGFKVATPNYTATYQLVTSWDMSPVSHVVRVSGRLDGFEALAGYKANTWTNHFGTIDTNLYYRGNAMQRDLDQYFLYITQSSNGMLQPGETEKVSIVVRGSSFYNATKAFTVKVGGVEVKPNDDDEISLSYKYADLKDELTRIPVTATMVTDKKKYLLEGQISIRRLVDTALSIVTNMENDPFIDQIEPKRIVCKVQSNTGFDRTSEVTKWQITRESSNSDADTIWAQRSKVKAFNGTIDIYWSTDATVNDIDLTKPTTKFHITATIGDTEEVTTTINV